MNLEKIIGRLRPAKEEKKKAEESIKAFISKIRLPKGAKIVMGGSYAKGTWISGMHDIDLFASFNYKKYKDKSDKLADILQTSIRRIEHKRVHGSRDYFEAKSGKYNFEIIPILEISKSGQALNITDVSPLHTKWVKRNIDEKKADGVRLLKAFFIAQGLYGAESYIRGFSGYASEILIANYNTFEKVLKAAVKWKNDKIIIDIEKHHHPRTILSELNASKIQSPLIIIDPVQKDRNVTAALSNDAFEAFKKSSFEFISKPTEEFFEAKKKTPDQLKKKSKTRETLVIEAVPLDGKKDVVYTKILKVKEHIEQKLDHHGFKVYKSGVEWNENPLIWIETDKKLPNHTIVKGPPTNSAEHLDRFKKIHGKQVFIKGRKSYAKLKREFTDPKILVSSIVKKDPYINERAKKVILHD